jgi:hypothetical protein
MEAFGFADLGRLFGRYVSIKWGPRSRNGSRKGSDGMKYSDD